MWMTGGSGAIGEMTQDQYNLEQGRLRAWMASRRLGTSRRKATSCPAARRSHSRRMNGTTVAVNTWRGCTSTAALAGASWPVAR